jgi:hypothetical protein
VLAEQEHRAEGQCGHAQGSGVQHEQLCEQPRQRPAVYDRQPGCAAAHRLTTPCTRCTSHVVAAQLVLTSRCQSLHAVMHVSNFPRAGGSAAEPEGKVVVQLCDGAIGTTRLATANARAAIDATQKLDFAVELEPATARNAGHLKVAGVVPLSEVLWTVPAPPCPTCTLTCVLMLTKSPWHRSFVLITLAAVLYLRCALICCAVGRRRLREGRAECGGGCQRQRHDDRDDCCAGDAVDWRRCASAAHVRLPIMRCSASCRCTCTTQCLLIVSIEVAWCTHTLQLHMVSSISLFFVEGRLGTWTRPSLAASWR